MRQKIAIVGGGWAGMACAVELAQYGHAVTVYEAAKQLGGRARSVNWEGLMIDNGQHLMMGAYQHTMRILNLIHGEQPPSPSLQSMPLQLINPDFHLRVRKFPAPLHLASGLLFARGLTLREKWAAIRFMQQLQALNFVLPADQSVSDLLAHHNQPTHLINKLWSPICIAALNTPLKQASAQIFCHVLRDTLTGSQRNSDLVMNRCDLNTLMADAAKNAITAVNSEVKLASKVKRISRHAEGFFLHGPDQVFTQVVIATHPVHLPSLLAELPAMDEIIAQVSAFTWQPILTLWLHFAAALKFPFPMFGLGDSSAPWAFERNDIAPGVVSLVMSAEGPHLALPAQVLRDEYLNLLTRHLGHLPTLLKWKTIIEKRATFCCTPNMKRPSNITPVEGIYLAGDYTREMDPTQAYPATLEGAIRSGARCAQLITLKLEAEN